MNHRVIRPALLATALLVPVALAAGEGRWEHIAREQGVDVYRREVAGSALVAFKGVTVVEAPLERVLWVLAENDRRTEWIDLCAESRVLERVSEHESVIYQRYALPWYLSDRDYVFRARAVREQDGAVRLLMASCEHPAAPPTVGVRARLLESTYVLTPLGERRTRVAVEIHTDPCGMVPDWLVNVVQKSWPLKTLQGIRKQVARPDAGSYPLPRVE
ncbi:MAG: START domain-containing protein [Planctomycetes bacterium]|nr:START domain-containing protein [Planctomycetota bacterium]